jgi:hypothetical protein
MIKFKWSILDVFAENELIVQAKYKVTIDDGENTVETEGNWFFDKPVLKVPFDQVTEEMVCSWIEQETMKDGVNLIKSRLEEQLKELNKAQSVIPPWMPQVFTPNI